MFDPIHFPARPFDVNAADPVIAGVNDQLKKAFADSPARWEIPLAIERTRSPANGVLCFTRSDKPVEISDFTIPGPAGDLRIRQFIPELTDKPAGIYLHFHAGGFCLGSASGQDGVLTELAHGASVIVLSVDYRLAPEHPYPAALADCEASAWWLVKHAQTRYGVDCIVLGGESAGSYLTLTTALRLRDRHGFVGLAGLNLSQGEYDLRITPSMSKATSTLAVDRPTFVTHMRRFFPDDAQRMRWEANPLFADLDRLPPPLMTIGSLDPCLDGNMFLYMRLLSCGVHAELNIYPGGFHLFNFIDSPLAANANQRIYRFVRNACLTV